MWRCLLGTRIAHVFQEPRLLPWRSVRDNILLMLPRGAVPAFADAALARVGLPESLGDAWPRQLSLGMARRVAIARALAVEPDLLLLDEPFASLDEEAAAKLRALLSRLHSERPRMGVVLVTHGLAEAASLAERVVQLGGAPATLVATVARPDGGWNAAGLRAALSAACRDTR